MEARRRKLNLHHLYSKPCLMTTEETTELEAEELNQEEAEETQEKVFTAKEVEEIKKKLQSDTEK